MHDMCAPLASLADLWLDLVGASLPLALRPLPASAMDQQQPPRMSEDEKRLARTMHFDDHKAPTAIAATLKRSLSSICRLCAKARPGRAKARPGGLVGKGRAQTRAGKDVCR